MWHKITYKTKEEKNTISTFKLIIATKILQKSQ